MITIEVTERGYRHAKGGATYRTVHAAMAAAEKTWERYGKQIEWAQDPASLEYVGFPYSPNAMEVL